MIDVLETVIKKVTDKQYNSIKKEQFGFLENDCTVIIFPIFIHCFENINIFDNKEYHNIIHSLNKL